MKFSVLMSLYVKENPSYLNDCLYSLYKQSIPASEIVLVLDGPVLDDHIKVIELWLDKLPIKIFKLDENIGLGKALNFGLLKCNFELIARMDTDDICISNRFELQLNEFIKDDSLMICGSCIREVESNSLEFISYRNVPLSDVEIKKYLPFRSPFNHMTVMYKKSAVLKCGSYQHLPLMEDWYLWCRLLSLGVKSKNLPDHLVVARTGLDMISRRSGISYVKSEWKMHNVRCRLKLIGYIKSLFIFSIRSIVRIMPKTIVQKIYLKIRKYK